MRFPMRAEPAGRRRASRDPRWDVAIFLACAALGAGLYARATVACGSLDLTQFEVTSVKKNGAAQALPAMKTGSIANRYGEAMVYDPDLGEFRSLRLDQRLP